MIRFTILSITRARYIKYYIRYIYITVYTIHFASYLRKNCVCFSSIYKFIQKYPSFYIVVNYSRIDLYVLSIRNAVHTRLFQFVVPGNLVR